jgi:hypothetical protein
LQLAGKPAASCTSTKDPERSFSRSADAGIEGVNPSWDFPPDIGAACIAGEAKAGPHTDAPTRTKHSMLAERRKAFIHATPFSPFAVGKRNDAPDWVATQGPKNQCPGKRAKEKGT